MKPSHSNLPKPVLFILGLFLVTLGVGTFYLIDNHTSLENVSNRTASFSRPGVITSLKDIAAEGEKMNLIGSTVILKETRVSEVLGDYVFTVSNGKMSVPIILLGESASRQPEKITEIQSGQTVKIIGILFPSEDMKTLTNPQFITKDELNRLDENQLFILGLRVESRSREAQEVRD